jgi:hypothetical protein
MSRLWATLSGPVGLSELGIPREASAGGRPVDPERRYGSVPSHRL